MKNPKSINCSVILTAALLLSTYARDKTAPAAAQLVADSPIASSTKSPVGAAEKASASFGAVLSSSQPLGWKISIAPKVIERGSPCLFTVTSAEALSSLTGSMMGKKVFFNHDGTRKTWYALAGVGLESPLGSQTITLKGSYSRGRTAFFDSRFEIEARRWMNKSSVASGRAVTFNSRFEIEASGTNIQVPPEYTDPDDEERARIAREALLKREVFKKLSDDALWNGSFLRPVDVGIRLTAVFGGTRRFNLGPVKTHRGVDFGAPQGTPVKAINSGRVILARNLFYDGNMVTIDHGQGLISLYLHLSKMDVEEGDTVSAGQLIGASGSTGRARGPQLHLQVKWAGTDIDPVDLMALKLPSNLAKSN